MKALKFIKTVVFGALILCCGVSFAAETNVSGTVSDSVITTKIKAAYAQEKVFGTKDISMMGVSVETKNGTVYLTGKVDNQAQIDNAIKVAKTIQGVDKVDSKLEVKPAS